MRLPLHYKLFTDEDYLDLTGPGDGFKRVDDVVGDSRTFQLPEPVKGDPQDLKAVIVQSPVVDLLRIRAEIKAIHLIPGQQPLFDQLLQVDEVGVAGKR